jgi:RimJ/RimL family protein N-acetyltransferase
VQPQSPAPGRTVLETPRLLLRELTPDDAPFALRLVNEPSWLRFIGDRGVRTLEDARRYLADGPIASYARNGFGLWAVVPHGAPAPAGMCGLIRRDSLPDVDVGFAFLPEAWGRGLAITDPGNVASIRVLERIGMRREGSVRMPGETLDLDLFARDLG